MSILTLNQGTNHQYTPDGKDIEGAISLNNLSDVTITVPLLNNQILVYSTATNQWINTTTGNVTTLEELTDVVVTNVQTGDVIAWNNTTSKWENTANSTANSEWENGTASVAVAIDDITDVTITGLTNGQVLQYNSTTSEWENSSTATSVALDNITDVTITSVANGQSLQYNSTTSKWENANIVAPLVDGGTY